MHSVLRRQLRKVGVDDTTPPDPAQWAGFLGLIDQTYQGDDEGRYLLERSLAISSREMRAAYDRQVALATCSQILLADSIPDQLSPAIDAVMDVVEGVCAALDVNLPPQPGVPLSRRRTAYACRLSDDHVTGSIETWEAMGNVAKMLATGRHVTFDAELCVPDLVCSMLLLPVVVDRRWLATLLIGRRSGTTWTRADIQLLTVVAEMIGHHLLRKETHERLEALSRSKDELIASVSHELRTPLTVVVGMAAELARTPHSFTSDEIEDISSMILRQSEDISNIVEDLLVAARASIGVLTVQLERVELDTIVQRFLADEVAPFAGRVEVALEPCAAKGDPVRIRQVLRNLVTNASKYGGDRLRIEVAAEPQPVIRVCDDGQGVPEERRHEIFELFTSLQDVHSQPNSVGIGLALSRELANLMHGDLTYDRRNGMTVFELSLTSA